MQFVKNPIHLAAKCHTQDPLTIPIGSDGQIRNLNLQPTLVVGDRSGIVFFFTQRMIRLVLGGDPQ
jgi:hypothetical protein